MSLSTRFWGRSWFDSGPGFVDRATSLAYCVFTFKSKLGVTRDPIYLFDISVQGLAERDAVENFGNASKARAWMVKTSRALWGIWDMSTFGVQDHVHRESDKDFG
ncbi:hypothetical protein C8R45DRAFT_933452 [Mycena sanguinolenta]|nr:hypothetical protein C8R45DRAFT_933452 [Mycena sanguinolenta]